MSKKNKSTNTSQGVRNLNHMQPKRVNNNNSELLAGICGKEHQIETNTYKEAHADIIVTECTVCGTVFDKDFINKR